MRYMSRMSSVFMMRSASVVVDSEGEAFTSTSQG